jgi:hypothetical protein
MGAPLTTHHDTLPDGTTITLVDSGQPPIEVMIDSMFGSLDFTEVITGLLMNRTIHFVDYAHYDGTLSDSNQVDYRTFLSLYEAHNYYLEEPSRLPPVPRSTITSVRLALSRLGLCGALAKRGAGYGGYRGPSLRSG